MLKFDGEVSSDIFVGLTQLQHRAHDSAGIATFDGLSYHLHKGMGELPGVFTEDILRSLKGSSGIGHVRWTTAGDINVANAHPISGIFRGEPFYLAHNGELTSRENLELSFSDYAPEISTDTKFVAALISNSRAFTFDEALREACTVLCGTYSLLVLYKDTVYGIRDITGNRPLVFGKTDHAFILSSETVAFDVLGGRLIREIKAGEVLRLEKGSKEPSSFMLLQTPVSMPRKLQFCLFEMIYLLHPASIFLGRTVERVRERMGENLFYEHPLDADIVIGVPDSGRAAAKGYARISDIPEEEGFIRSHYAGRMFIEPVAKRPYKLLIKLRTIREVIYGKRVVVIDDSIVEGRTAKKVVGMLRDAGAKSIFFLSSSPPITHPCYYGVPTARIHRRLIAKDHATNIDVIRQEIGADYLGYLSLEATVDSVIETIPVVEDYPCLEKDDFCTACFTGIYPIPLN